MIMPKYGGNSFGFSAGRLSGPEIRFGPFAPRCLSKIILFIVLANSKLTSLKRVVVSDELFPLSYLVFYVMLRILLTSSLSISGI